MEAPDEKGHFYLSEVPTYDQLIESDRKLSEDLERKTSIIPTQDFTENGIPIKTPVISGESIEQENNVCILIACSIIYKSIYAMHVYFVRKEWLGITPSSSLSIIST